MTAPYAGNPLVFVDLETTGANFANDRIIEIGLVQVDEDGVREWSALVNPQQAISPFITGLTGIDDTMLVDASSFSQLAPLVLEKLRGRLLIAHNARFDYGFLKGEFRRIGVNFQSRSLCTVKLSRKLFPEHHRHNLDTLVERYGIVASERHRALADARILWDLWQRWHETLPAETFGHAVDAIGGRPELPPQLDPGLLDDLPEAPGAYACHDDAGSLLQVKQAHNLRQEILALFAPSRRDTALARNTRHIEWRETAGDLGARLGEIELSRPLRKKTEELCAWQLVEYAEGDFRPRLVFSSELDFGATEDLFGLYNSRREAANALRKLADAHRLCHAGLGIGETAKNSACVGYRQKTCRGLCVGKESASQHSARLMAALAKFKIKAWPFPGPVAVVEKDEFGMRRDFHLFDRWRHFGAVHNEQALAEHLESIGRIGETPFDADIYRALRKALQAGKVSVLQL